MCIDICSVSGPALQVLPKLSGKVSFEGLRNLPVSELVSGGAVSQTQPIGLWSQTLKSSALLLPEKRALSHSFVPNAKTQLF